MQWKKTLSSIPRTINQLSNIERKTVEIHYKKLFSDLCSIERKRKKLKVKWKWNFAQILVHLKKKSVGQKYNKRKNLVWDQNRVFLLKVYKSSLMDNKLYSTDCGICKGNNFIAKKKKKLSMARSLFLWIALRISTFINIYVNNRMQNTMFNIHIMHSFV